MEDASLKQPIYVWDYDAQCVIRYARTGTCSKCGRCCQGYIQFHIARPYDSQNPHQGGQATTGQGPWVEVQHQEQRVFFKIEGYQPQDRQCAHYNQITGCASYQRRPLLCREFPLTPHDIDSFPECTYQFQKTGQWTFHQLGIMFKKESEDHDERK